MAKDKWQVVEELLSTVELNGDLGSGDVRTVAVHCAEFELEESTDINSDGFHERVQGALGKLPAEQVLNSTVEYALTLLEHGEGLIYEEDLRLASLFEEIGSLMFFQVELDEARRVELLDAFGEFLKNRRRRGEFKGTFLDTYRNRMSQIAELPVIATAIHMMNLEYLIDKET